MTSERLTDRLGEARNKREVLAVFEHKREKPSERMTHRKDGRKKDTTERREKEEKP